MIFHYTSLKALTLILTKCVLRLSRLDLLDDPMEKYVNEDKVGKPVTGMFLNSPRDVAKHCFVSSWTCTEDESVAMWEMYGDGKLGVRIGLSETTDIFDLDLIISEIISVLEKKTSLKIHNKETMRRNTVIPELIAVNYQKADDMPSFYNKMREPDWDTFGKYKTEDWAFQNELRYRVYAFKDIKTNYVHYSHPDSINDYGLMGEHWDNDIRILPEYHDMPVRESVLRNMSITVGPLMDEADQVILALLIRRFRLIIGNVSESKFKDKKTSKGAIDKSAFENIINN